jgi:SAM-dependent methyltransferase
MIERVDLENMSRDPSWASHVFRYERAARICRGRNVLDVGHGNGYGAALLKIKGQAESVLAIDLDPEAVKGAQKAWATSGSEYMAFSAESLEQIGRRFDLICSFENIEHLPHPERFLAGAAAQLEPEGLLFVSTPDRAVTPPFVDGRPVNPYHVHEWYRDEFEEMLKQHFHYTYLFSQVVQYSALRRAGAEKQLAGYIVGLETLLDRSTRWHKWLGRLPIIGASYRGAPEVRYQKIQLDYPAIHDHAIVDPRLVCVYGKSLCHVAVCSQVPVPDSVMSQLVGGG